MDNNSSFEQQFVQNIQNAAQSQVEPPRSSKSSSASQPSPKIPLIISLILAVIVLIEAIALLIVTISYFSLSDAYYNYEVSISDESDSGLEAYSFDTEGNLTAISLNCTSDNGTYNFKSDNTYEQQERSSGASSSGAYSILNDSLISLSGSNDSEKVLYFDGFDIADGTTIYQCEEITTGANTQ